MSLLIELTLRGSAAALLVVALDRILAGRMSGTSRRWWWCFVPLAFLFPLRLPILPAPAKLPQVAASWNGIPIAFPSGATARATTAAGHPFHLLAFLWLIGAAAYLALVVIQTIRVSRRWSGERLSTDHALLELLEDCKSETGVTAPIGLVVSSSVPSPAILGWLRPRILMPASLAESGTAAEIRPILLHELAHFRWYDIPFNWLLTLARAIHWFNPVAHWGAMAWARFREEAADEAAMKWMRDDSGQAYGEALVRTLRHTQANPVPFGALAIVESLQHLKTRINMIHRYPGKSPRILLAGMVSLLLAVMIFTKWARAAGATPADEKAAVAASAQAWMKDSDDGNYGQSWADASTVFKTHVTAEKWGALGQAVRGPLGKCTTRRQVSLVFKKDVGGMKGEFAIVQFDSSFENLKHAFETVSFYQEADGTWKGAGYYIKALGPPSPSGSEAEQKEITLDAKILGEYAGQYQLTPSLVITITRAGDHLYAQATGQGQFEIFPESKTKFFAKITELSIDFQSDAMGKVTGFVLRQNGMTGTAARVE